MSTALLEHANITVSDPVKTAELLCHLFDWRIRWQGTAIHNGYTVHVGSDDQYLAVFSMDGTRTAQQSSYEQVAALNHLGIVVDDLDAVERRVQASGFKTFNHGDYEPGRRFYFRDRDAIEFEIVSYTETGSATS